MIPLEADAKVRVAFILSLYLLNVHLCHLRLFIYIYRQQPRAGHAARVKNAQRAAAANVRAGRLVEPSPL